MWQTLYRHGNVDGFAQQNVIKLTVIPFTREFKSTLYPNSIVCDRLRRYQLIQSTTHDFHNLVEDAFKMIIERLE